VLANRVELVRAQLILAHAWYAAGCPQDETLPAMATFTPWVKTVGSILAFAGVRGFLGNLYQVRDSLDTERAQWETFLRSWHVVLGERRRSIGELVLLFHPETIIQHPIADLLARMARERTERALLARQAASAESGDLADFPELDESMIIQPGSPDEAEAQAMLEAFWADELSAQSESPAETIPTEDESWFMPYDAVDLENLTEPD
jgi:hypothetical protein